MVNRILVADDNVDVRQKLRTVLNSDSMQICGEVDNGQDAIESAKQLKPDIVLLDVTMPVLNGIEAAYEIRRATPRAKIIFFSSHDSPNMMAAARLVGADAFVSKSDANAIAPTVKRLLKERVTTKVA